MFNAMKEPANKPHDHFVRRALSHRQVARSFFQQHLPPSIRDGLDLDHLEMTGDSFIDLKLRESVSDMVFSAPLKRRKAYIYLLLEHKSHGLDELPAPMEKYRLEAMNHYARAKGKKRYPLVVPLVLYHGKSAYRGPVWLQDCIDAPPEMIEEAYRSSFILVDLSRYSDEDLKTQAWTGVFQLMLKHIRDPDILRRLTPLIPLMQIIEKESGGLEFLEIVFRYLFQAGRVENINEVVEVAVKSLGQKTEEAVMTIAEQLKAEGKKEGLEEGKREGLEEGKITGREEGKKENQAEVAMRLIGKGISLDFVAEVTELPLDALRRLQNKKRP